MTSLISKRLLTVVPTLLVLTVLAFLLVHALPGDPAQVMLGPNASAEQIARLRDQLGVDQPWIVQYGEYLANLLQGDLGTSVRTQQPIAETIVARTPATIELAVAAMFIGAPLGLLVGRMTGRFARTPLDAVGDGLGVVMVSIPTFVLGLLLQWVFAVQLHALPSIGRLTGESTGMFLVLPYLMTGHFTEFWDAVRHLILPAVTLAAVPFAIVARMTRATYLDNESRPHVRVAHAKGIRSARVRSGHIYRNSWPPLLIVIGLQFGALLAGSLIVENIFDWGGLGSLLVDAIQNRDYVVLQSSLLVVALIYLVVNLLVDLMAMVTDPRLRAAS